MFSVITFIFGIAVGIILQKLFFVQKKDAGWQNPFVKQQSKQKQDNKKKIIELLQKREQVSNNDVEKLLGVSNATAERYLDQLEKEGKIIQVGKTGWNVTYKLNASTRLRR